MNSYRDDLMFYHYGGKGQINKYLDELYHHGVKGQRWGVRRYQNEDGSLTSAGKSRIKAKDDIRSVSDMDDRELRTRVQRLRLERDYTTLSSGNKGGKEHSTEVEKLLDRFGSNAKNLGYIMAIGTTALNAYISYLRIKSAK